MNTIAAEKNATIVFPMPIDFFKALIDENKSFRLHKKKA